MARLFVALDVPPLIKQMLEGLQGGVPGARWVNSDMFHITLAFLGEVDSRSEADIISALAPVTVKPFDLTFDGLDTFGDKKRVRSIHVRVKNTPELNALQHSVVHALKRLGFESEHKRYTPHVTLARLKFCDMARVGRFIEETGPVRLPPVTVRGFTLFESHLAHTGAHYLPRCEFGGDNEIAHAEAL